MVSETSVSVDDFIYPLFLAHGRDVKEPIPPMPGIFQLSLDMLLPEIDEITALGIPAVLLFGLPSSKDALGSEAYDEHGIIQEGIRVIKQAAPDLMVITDVCLCEYTDHGHCGVLFEDGRVDNDATLELLARTAVSHVEAGADMVAPSAMMDGQIAALRRALDSSGYSDTPIMAYAAKYSSAFYGPFRIAAGSSPQQGDRKAYQMDPGSTRQAMREMELDHEEGADILMVKPALAYLDVLSRARQRFDVPLAAYNVSGEYSMVKAAAQAGWLDERQVVIETMTSLKRAGADLIITYHAKDAAAWLNE
ncbi:MAG: porphobilinogen synthase [Chloroflexi bacterium]|nr:MAG: porphobilinogen synthase [Chloroflexota bacterium]